MTEDLAQEGISSTFLLIAGVSRATRPTLLP
jgi:hypothetical protein